MRAVYEEVRSQITSHLKSLKSHHCPIPCFGNRKKVIKYIHYCNKQKLEMKIVFNVEGTKKLTCDKSGDRDYLPANKCLKPIVDVERVKRGVLWNTQS